MEQLIARLIGIGYTPDEAHQVYQLYERMGELPDLEAVVEVKEEGAQLNAAMYDWGNV